MKTTSLSGLLVLFLCFIGFVSCNSYLLDEKEEKEKEEKEKWFDSVPDGGSFLRANTLRIYYLDKNGNSLINPYDQTTFPVSWWEELANPKDQTMDYDWTSGFYNGNHNEFRYDEEERLYYCTVTAYGDSKQSTYSFPMYVNGDVDTMEITYKYSIYDVIGANYWSKIISWKYNGTHIYSDDDDNEYGKKVFIKKANRKTIVSLTR